MKTYDLHLIPNGMHYFECACPRCGAIQHIGTAVECEFDCAVCGLPFWIAHVRMVSYEEPAWARILFSTDPTQEANAVTLTNK